MYCPRCNQGVLEIVEYKKLNVVIVLCHECDALWLPGAEVRFETFFTLDAFMSTHGVKDPWPYLNVLGRYDPFEYDANPLDSLFSKIDVSTCVIRFFGIIYEFEFSAADKKIKESYFINTEVKLFVSPAGRPHLVRMERRWFDPTSLTETITRSLRDMMDVPGCAGAVAVASDLDLDVDTFLSPDLADRTIAFCRQGQFPAICCDRILMTSESWRQAVREARSDIVERLEKG